MRLMVRAEESKAAPPRYKDTWEIHYRYADGRVLVVPEPDAATGVKWVVGVGGACVALGMGLGATLGLRIAAGRDKTITLLPGGLSLALKALAYGTALSVTCAGVGVYAAARLLGVSSIREFGDLMRKRVPEHTENMPRYMQPLRSTLERLFTAVAPDAVTKRTPKLDASTPESRKAMEDAWDSMVGKPKRPE